MRLVLLGPPGAGKGTQAVVLSQQYKIPHISTGEILRTVVAEGKPLGLLAKGYMDKGELVPDELILEIVGERLKEADTANGFILDGFPRTLPQARALDKILNGSGRGINLVINFVTSPDVAIMRLGGRRVCRKCGANYHVKNMPPRQEGICDKCGGELYQRRDDVPSTVKNRLRVYEEQTKDLIDYYKKRSVLRSVDGDLEVKEANAAVRNIFEEEKVA